MNRGNRRSEHMKTKFIRIDNRKCEACWECLNVCANGVIGKVEFLFHKHSHINNPEACKGCRKCVKACKYKAISVL